MFPTKQRTKENQKAVKQVKAFSNVSFSIFIKYNNNKMHYKNQRFCKKITEISLTVTS